MVKHFSRRFVLVSAASLPVLGSTPAHSFAYPPRNLMQLLPHRDRARRIGLRYLKLDRHANILVEQVLRRLDAADPDIRVAARSCIQEDFHQHRIVLLDGWAISETEAALCVLCAVENGIG